MAREDPIYDSNSPSNASVSYELAEFDDQLRRTSPSLSIILISAASGIGAGVIGLYLSYQVLGLGIELSAGVATLLLCFALGGAGAIMSAITGSRSALSNIGFSCGLVVLVAVFLALCSLVGAFFATIMLTTSV